MIVVVPAFARTFASSPGAAIQDSICICASMNPGTRYFPVQSISSFPSYLPTPTIVSPQIATSAFNTSSVNTFNTFPFFNTRSAFSRPFAQSNFLFLSNICFLFSLYIYYENNFLKKSPTEEMIDLKNPPTAAAIPLFELPSPFLNELYKDSA